MIKSTWADKRSQALKRTYREDGRYVSHKQVEDPFYVVVHLDLLNHHYWREYFPETVARTLREVAEIKRKFPYLDYDIWPPVNIHPRTPLDMTILVCGCYDLDCVERQRGALITSGRNAYISDEGTPALFRVD